MPFSYHSHSGQFCLHAKNTLEEMVRAAVARKMRVFAMTEHMPRDQLEDLYPEEIEASQTVSNLFDTFDRFYEEAVRLREIYASQIHLLIGFECDWIRPSSRKLILNLLEKYKFDLFVGSVHHVNTIPIDIDRPTYEKARDAVEGTDERLFEAYLDDQLEMLQTLKPPIVGHFDLIRLKSDNPDTDFRQYPGVWARVLRNLDFISTYGGLIEINSAAWRKGMSEPYPKREICEAFLDRGGCFTLSDDSHAVDQVGLNYHLIPRFLRDVGIQLIHYLELDSGRPILRSCNVEMIFKDWQSKP